MPAIVQESFLEVRDGSLLTASLREQPCMFQTGDVLSAQSGLSNQSALIPVASHANFKHATEIPTDADIYEKK